MARRSSKRSRIPRRWRGAKLFVVTNLLLWGALGVWFTMQPIERRQDVSQLVRNAVEGRKQITAFDVVWDVWQLYYSQDFVAGVAAGDKAHVYGGAPHLAAERGSVRVLSNTGYVAGYSDAFGNPLWVAYRVDDLAPQEAPPRPDRFAVDPRTVARIEPDVYSRSGYDRGHLAPNQAIATRYGPRAQEETFLMSNIVPQKHELNAGPWKQLEQRIAANYPGRFREVWVLAGPIFGERPSKLGRRVAVPEAFYMIVVDESDGRVRTASFILPQQVRVEAELDHYLVSIDEIERRTGIDFLHELPDAVETVLEAKRIERVW